MSQDPLVIRADLERSYYDPCTYIESLLSQMEDGIDDERELFEMFNKATNNLTHFADQIEQEVGILQYSVKNAGISLHVELEQHSDKLETIESAVNETITNFKIASEGALRIGSRLASSEDERKRIVRSIDLMNCIKLFQNLEIGKAVMIKVPRSHELMKLDYGNMSDNENEDDHHANGDAEGAVMLLDDTDYRYWLPEHLREKDMNYITLVRYII